jgi:endonuclease YncB( thermonuclease family)
MFLLLRTLSHPARGGTAIMVAAVFLLGLAAGAAISPELSNRKAAAHAAAPNAPPDRPVEKPAASSANHPVQVVRVLDGDTFEARVSVWPGIDITTKVRLRGIDAPELRARCAEERTRAQSARDALISLLAEGTVGISRVTPDKYGGRVVAAAATRKKADISAALLNAGLVRRYSGGRRQSWC